ncbi:hypothetical protein B0H17DRAFT_647681 [Mycena rosella]|uniref:Uncharacterized protein n=1 Tax=Mycena rosella TaxID=1033263 RepID=A0AAD7GI51_MYCRO|nr:hypothetical protein B0H17DRAFT_647681 [Mycena rosella]
MRGPPQRAPCISKASSKCPGDGLLGGEDRVLSTRNGSAPGRRAGRPPAAAREPGAIQAPRQNLAEHARVQVGGATCARPAAHNSTEKVPPRASTTRRRLVGGRAAPRSAHVEGTEDGDGAQREGGAGGERGGRCVRRRGHLNGPARWALRTTSCAGSTWRFCVSRCVPACAPWPRGARRCSEQSRLSKLEAGSEKQG